MSDRSKEILGMISESERLLKLVDYNGDCHYTNEAMLKLCLAVKMLAQSNNTIKDINK